VPLAVRQTRNVLRKRASGLTGRHYWIPAFAGMTVWALE